MEYVSTRGKSTASSTKKAILSTPKDNGLWVPGHYPIFSQEEIHDLKGEPYHVVAAEILYPFVRGEIPRNEFDQMTERALDFEIPINDINGIYVADLGQVPTGSFKEFGIREQAELVLHYTNGDIVIFTVTSGDTGASAANAYGKKGIKTLIAYDGHHISKNQERLMNVENVTAFNTNNDFDHLYKLLKEVEQNPNYEGKVLIANSRNIGRLLPHIAYYFYIYSNLAEKGEEIVFSIPYGNGSNFFSAEMARKMGLPVKKSVAANNENDTFTRFLRTGVYAPRETVHTRSLAMDIPRPGNFERFVFFYDGMHADDIFSQFPNMDGIRDKVSAYSVSDENTIGAIKRSNGKIEFHAATAMHAAEQFKQDSGYDGKIVVLETAQRGKFIREMEDIGFEVEPEGLMRQELEDTNTPKGTTVIIPDLTSQRLIQELDSIISAAS